MATPSPFSLYYNDLATKTPAPSSSYPTAESPQNNSKRSLFKEVFEEQRPGRSLKKEPRIKVFGLGSKKKSVEDRIGEMRAPGSSNSRELIQNREGVMLRDERSEENLLGSERGIRNEGDAGDAGTVGDGGRKQAELSELHKLLDLSEEMGKEQERVERGLEYDGDEVEQLVRQIQRSGDGGKLIAEIERKELEVNRKAEEKQNSRSERRELIFGQTDSFIIPSKSHTENSSKLNSRIIELIDNLTESPEGLMRKINEEALKQDIVNKLNMQKRLLDKDLASQNRADESILKQIYKKKPVLKDQHIQTSLILEKNIKSPPASHPQAIWQPPKQIKLAVANTKAAQPKPFVPLPNKKTSTNIMNYLTHYGSYSAQIDNLINRYQKVQILKQKDKQIKKQLKQLAQKDHYSGSHENFYNYRPEVDANQHRDLYYTNQFSRNPSSELELSNHKKQRSCEQSITIDHLQCQNDIQTELNRNVANMQKIITKFKQISKTIEVGEGSSIRKETIPKQLNRRSMVTDNISNYYLNMPSGASVERNKRSEVRSVDGGALAQTLPLMKMPAMRKGEGCESENFIDSVQEIGERRCDLNFCSARLQNKNSARTEKRGVLDVYSKGLSGKEREKYDCRCEHDRLVQEIDRLSKKVNELEQVKGKDVKRIKSEEYVQGRPDEDKRKEGKEVRRKESKRKFEDDIESNQEEYRSVNVSIRPQQKGLLQQCEDKGQYNESKYKKGQSQNVRRGLLSQPKSQRHSHRLRLETKQKRDEQDKKVKHKSKGKKDLLQSIKIKRINFPIFYNFPSKKDSLSQLVQIGQYMFRILYKFVINRQNLSIDQLQDRCIFKVKKYIDCIHYFTPNELNYHLIYHFKGKIYFGQWQSQQIDTGGYKQGFGYYSNPKKYVYEGQFTLDQKHGYGMANYVNGQFYEGGWNEGRREGKGLLVNPMGDVYRGHFRGGRKEGRGEEQFSNGDVYKGEFRAGKIEGGGTYTWADGSFYKGNFKEGRLDGNGVWKSRQNDCYEGEFKNNKKQGEGTYKWNNGVMFKGYFAEDQRKIQNDYKVDIDEAKTKRRSARHRNKDACNSPNLQKKRSKRKY